jgi:hypothetical protein
MRINYKNWPMLKYLENFDKVAELNENKDWFNQYDKSKAIFFSRQFFSGDIFIIRKTFEKDAKRNRVKLWNLFIQELWGNNSHDVNFNHRGIMLFDKVIVYYNLSLNPKILTVDVFNPSGAFYGHAHCLDSNEENDLIVHTTVNPYFNKIKESDEFLEFLPSLLQHVIIFMLFKQFSNVETKHLCPNEKYVNKKLGHKDLNETDLSITILDSTWYTNLIRSEGFKVSGHPRLQPCKIDGEWTYKLIWINEFMKHGYTRTAKKLTQQEIA